MVALDWMLPLPLHREAIGRTQDGRLFGALNVSQIEWTAPPHRRYYGSPAVATTAR
ncbi:hypothetical protein CCUS01_03038 [Colletotrichum cuscutae]|uniref:Uncharacterized protein n=1 Tax=Colletotrichum cuscutae TaxID=1209917 RepID=A0AAI9YAY3_9PEZI|nr:hypothetical protein CCUS01_03038 [Colletotrichum cuscutae]